MQGASPLTLIQYQKAASGACYVTIELFDRAFSGRGACKTARAAVGVMRRGSYNRTPSVLLTDQH